MAERSSHITRVFGTNRAGDKLDDFFIDVRRMDASRHIDSHKVVGQETDYFYACWDDHYKGAPDPDDDGLITRTIKIYDPQSPPDDPDDPDEWIPLKLIYQITMIDSHKVVGQEVLYQFNNSPVEEGQEDTSKRTVKKMRVTHSELDEGTNARLNAEESISDEEYSRTEEVDERQYLDAEFIVINEMLSADPTRGQEEAFYWDVENDPILATLQPTPDVNEDGTPIKVWRLDPLQQIVNCQLTPQVYVIVISNVGTIPEILVEESKARIVATEIIQYVVGDNVLAPVSVTLIEASANVGDDFMAITGTFGSTEFGSEGYIIWVAPHTDEVRDNYVQWYGWAFFGDPPDGAVMTYQPFDAGSGIPFLWYGVQQILAPAGTTAIFSMSVEQHLNNPGPGDKDRIVQLWVNNDPTSFTWDGNFMVFGWVNSPIYRTDRKGEGPIYWWSFQTTIDQLTINGGVVSQSGLPFGKPAKIDFDEPL